MIVWAKLLRFENFLKEIIIHCFLFWVFSGIEGKVLEGNGNGLIRSTIKLEVFSYNPIIFHVGVGRPIHGFHLVDNMLEGLPDAIFDHLFLSFFQLLKFWNKIVE